MIYVYLLSFSTTFGILSPAELVCVIMAADVDVASLRRPDNDKSNGCSGSYISCFDAVST